MIVHKIERILVMSELVQKMCRISPGLFAGKENLPRYSEEIERLTRILVEDWREELVEVVTKVYTNSNDYKTPPHVRIAMQKVISSVYECAQSISKAMSVLELYEIRNAMLEAGVPKYLVMPAYCAARMPGAIRHLMWSWALEEDSLKRDDLIDELQSVLECGYTMDEEGEYAEYDNHHSW